MTPFERSQAALPVNIRKTLEESNLPVEVATAIADEIERLRQGWIDANKNALAERMRPEARDTSARLLLEQVRREWYTFTGYSQLKADIDYYLDADQPRSSMANDIAKQIENGAPGDSQSNR